MADSKFRFKVDYFGLLSKHIVEGQYVNGEKLAEGCCQTNWIGTEEPTIQASQVASRRLWTPPVMQADF